MKWLHLWLIVTGGLCFSACKKSVSTSGGSVVDGRNADLTAFTGNNLTDSNAVSSSAGLTTPFAASFLRASKQSLIVPSNPTLQIGASDLTIAAWVKFGSIGPYNQVIAAKDNDSTVEGSDYWMGYNSTTRTLQFQVETAVKTRPAPAVSYGIPQTNSWIFVVGWYDHLAGKVHIQVNNGRVDSAAAESETRVTNTAFSLGSDVSAGSFLNGELNSVGLWKRVLTAEERATLYNISFGAPGQPEGVGRVPGTMVNGAGRVADVPAPLAVNGYSLYLDGASQYVKIKSLLTLKPLGGAISIWFKTNSFSKPQAIVGSSTNANTYISLLDAGTIRVQTDRSGTYKDFLFGSLPANAWNHLVLNRDNQGNSHVYLNGQESSSQGQPQPDDALTIDQIGRYSNGTKDMWFHGNFSTLRIYDAPLSPSDIQLLYAGEETLVHPALFYKANESSGTALLDYASYTGGLNYAQLPQQMIDEPASSFISWWDLSETAGTRYDRRGTALP